MHSTNPLAGFVILARTNTLNQDYVLCQNKTDGQYMTAEIDHHTRKIKTTRKFTTAGGAYQDYFSSIASPLNMDRQSLAILLITPEPEMQNQSTRAKQNTTNSKQQTGKGSPYSGRNDPPLHNRNLRPASFFVPGKTPEWLEGKEDMLLLENQMNIIAGNQYKLLATHLKPNARETDSQIYLEDQNGRCVTISLATACSCFLYGHAPHPPLPQHHHNDQT